MPLYYQQNINETTKLAVWKITEEDSFFIQQVPLKQSIAHPLIRLQHLAGRYLLTYLFPDFPISLIEIADTRKPFLPQEDFHFSISHCGNYAAAIVSCNKRVGIDVELVTNRVERIKNKFLNDEELKSLQIVESPTNFIEKLTVLWSAKEAMFKWWGRGDIDFRDVMRTHPFELNSSGTINADFIKNDFFQQLNLQYKLQNELSLVWIVSDFN